MSCEEDSLLPEELNHKIELLHLAKNYTYENLIYICGIEANKALLCLDPELWKYRLEFFLKTSNYTPQEAFENSVERSRWIYVSLLLHQYNIDP